MAWVAVLMGSESDWPAMRSCTDVLADLEVAFEVRVTSAHRTPEATADYVRSAQDRGCRVFVCGAGLAAHLAGAVAAQTTHPVIGVPMDGGPLSGQDALLSTVMMPGGVPVGMEILGLPYREGDLLALAYSFEQATQHRRAPACAPEL